MTKGRRAVVTATAITSAPFAALDLADARREGYARLEDARAAFLERFPSAGDGDVWVIAFLLGDHSALYERPVFLAARDRAGTIGADYTTLAQRAVREGGEAVEVVPAISGASERARITAAATRSQPDRDRIESMLGQAESLRGSLASMQARNRARLIAHQLEKLHGELMPQVVGSGPGHTANGPAHAMPTSQSSETGASGSVLDCA